MGPRRSWRDEVFISFYGVAVSGLWEEYPAVVRAVNLRFEGEEGKRPGWTRMD